MKEKVYNVFRILGMIGLAFCILALLTFYIFEFGDFKVGTNVFALINLVYIALIIISSFNKKIGSKTSMLIWLLFIGYIVYLYLNNLLGDNLILVSSILLILLLAGFGTYKLKEKQGNTNKTDNVISVAISIFMIMYMFVASFNYIKAHNEKILSYMDWKEVYFEDIGSLYIPKNWVYTKKGNVLYFTDKAITEEDYNIYLIGQELNNDKKRYLEEYVEDITEIYQEYEEVRDENKIFLTDYTCYGESIFIKNNVEEKKHYISINSDNNENCIELYAWDDLVDSNTIKKISESYIYAEEISNAGNHDRALGINVNNENESFIYNKSTNLESKYFSLLALEHSIEYLNEIQPIEYLKQKKRCVLCNL